VAAINTAWDETAPAGGDALSAGDDSIRAFKLSLRERLRNGGHNMPITSPTTVEADGRHSCGEAFDAGSAVSLAGEFYIYAADLTTAVATFRDSTAATPSELFLGGNKLRTTGNVTAATLTLSGNATIGGTLAVTSTVTFSAAVTFNAAATFNAAETFSAGLTVTGGSLDVETGQFSGTTTSVASGTVAVTSGMRVILANLTGNAILTLPAAASSSGRELWVTIASSDLTSRTLTIDPNGSESIDGVTGGNPTLVLRPKGSGSTDAYKAVHIICDGTAWFIVGANTASSV
jgi:hypothetical protein